MKNLAKTLLLVSLVTITTIQAHPGCSSHFHAHAHASWSVSDLSWKEIALYTGAGIATLAALKCAYNYFFTLSDLQEIEAGQTLNQKAILSHNNLVQAYKPLGLIIAEAQQCSNCHDTYFEVKEIILNSASRRFPFNDYVTALDNDIYTNKRFIDDLAAKKIHLFERKLQFTHAKNDTMNAHEVHALQLEYDKTISVNEYTHDKCQTLHYLLHQIRNYVIAMKEYQNECKEIRIEQLELENARLQAQNTAHIYAHAYAMAHKPQPQTHIHVYKQETVTNNTTITQAEPKHVVTVAPVIVPAVAATEYCAPICPAVETSANVATPDARVETYSNFRDEVMFVG